MADQFRRPAVGSLPALGFACGAALLVGLTWRFSGWDRPLWADEVFTGAIARQPSFSTFIQDCLHELSGPVFYGLEWLWAKIFGVSTLSLRIPSFLLSIAAPLIISWRGNPDRIIRLVWASAVAVTHMCAYFAWEARSYSFLFLLGTLQVMCFVPLVRNLSPRPMLAWIAISVVLALTHYFTLPMTAVQIAILIVMRRTQVLHYWYYAFLCLPLLVWMYFHLPMLAGFLKMAWQPIINRHELVEAVGLAFGSGKIVLLGVIAGCLIVAVTFLIDCIARLRAARPLPYHVPDLLAVAAGVGGLAIIIAYGIVQHSFTPRYLMPLMPALLLAPAVWARRMALIWPAMPAAFSTLLAGIGALLAGRDLLAPGHDIRSDYQWQSVSNALIAAGVQHVAVLWDAPETAILSESLVRRTNGFFFDRAGRGISVSSVIVADRNPFPDPNILLPALLDSTRRPGVRDGFIWMYVPARTAESVYPVRYAELARNFDCRNYSVPNGIPTLGCIRR